DYLPPPVLVMGHTNVHDAGSTSAAGVIFSGVRLFFDSRLLNATRSTPSIVFHAFIVALNSLQPDSHVSTSALVGGMSMPFCESGARTVVKIPLINLNVSTLPGARAGAPPNPPPPPPPRPGGGAPPVVASFVSRAVAAVATSAGREPRAIA